MRLVTPNAVIAFALAVVFTLALASLVLGVIASLRMARAAEAQWAPRQYRPGR
jgi:hypothetical protein